MPGCATCRIAVYSEEAKKKATQEDVTKLEARLRRDATYVGTADLHRTEQARSLMQAKSASGSRSAFSSDARAVAAVGQVRECFASDLEKYEEKDEGKEGDDDADGDEGEKAKELGKGKVAKVVDPT